MGAEPTQEPLAPRSSTGPAGSAPVASASRAPAAQPARDRARRRTQERRTRAWAIAAALGTASFAWAFGYIYGEIRAGSDPGLRTASAAIQSQSRLEQPDARPVDPQQQFPQQVDPQQQQQQQPAMPPLTTRQS